MMEIIFSKHEGRMVRVDELIQWLNDNTEFVYTRNVKDGDYNSEEKRFMIWKRNLIRSNVPPIHDKNHDSLPF